jgi:hypothetical protein
METRRASSKLLFHFAVMMMMKRAALVRNYAKGIGKTRKYGCGVGGTLDISFSIVV